MTCVLLTWYWIEEMCPTQFFSLFFYYWCISYTYRKYGTVNLMYRSVCQEVQAKQSKASISSLENPGNLQLSFLISNSSIARLHIHFDSSGIVSNTNLFLILWGLNISNSDHITLHWLAKYWSQYLLSPAQACFKSHWKQNPWSKQLLVRLWNKFTFLRIICKLFQTPCLVTISI